MSSSKITTLEIFASYLKRLQEGIKTSAKVTIYIEDLFMTRNKSCDIDSLERFLRLKSNNQRTLKLDLERNCGIEMIKCKKKYNIEFVVSKESNISDLIIRRYADEEPKAESVSEASMFSDDNPFSELMSKDSEQDDFEPPVDFNELFTSRIGCSSYTNNSNSSSKSTFKKIVRRKPFKDIKDKKYKSELARKAVFKIQEEFGFNCIEDVYDLFQYAMNETCPEPKESQIDSDGDFCERDDQESDEVTCDKISAAAWDEFKAQSAKYG